VVIVFHARNLVFNGIICHFHVKIRIIRIMSTNSKYQIIFNKIASIQYSDEQIENIKSRYTSEINSKRRLCSITSLTELLEILEKRDYLNPNNTDPLMEIAVYFRESSVISLLKDYHNKNVVENVSPSRDNHGQRSVFAPVPTDPKERVHQIIASNIGQKWIDFARALHIPEGKIDDLSTSIPNIHNRVHQILEHHEKTCDEREWRSILLDALAEARRNDIRKKVQKVLDTSS
jgi:hypothetical protein